MQFVIRPRRVPRSSLPRAGFTLIELLVALSVIGVASTVFMKMYATSMDLGTLSRDRQIAEAIAVEQLNLLLLNPAGYVWDSANPNDDGMFRIRATEDEPRAGVLATPPKVLPFDEQARQTQTLVFDKFRSKAFGKLSERGWYYEVYVDVHWTQGGKDEHLVLTGAVSRSRVEPGWTEGSQ